MTLLEDQHLENSGSRSTRPVRTTGEPRPGGRPPAWREFLLVATLWLAYGAGRRFATGRLAAAFANAEQVWDIERLLRLPNEADLQHLLLRQHTLVVVANGYYAYVHFPAMIAFLVWLYRHRPGHYRPTRNTLALLTAAALAIHVIYPLAPPRMLGEAGVVDTGRIYGPTVYGAPDSDNLTNQFAAMPSLHIGWAILIAVSMIIFARSRWRWLWVAHPIMTIIVVVATANHYWLDGIVVAVLLFAIHVRGALVRPFRRGGPAIVQRFTRPELTADVELDSTPRTG